MKKSFKKAGAAVLSMSMLLAMGAVSMPVYAANPEDFPGQVKVVIDGTAWADEDSSILDQDGKWTEKGTNPAVTHDGRKYSYLDDVDTATVRLYKVATLDASGWKWESDFQTAMRNHFGTSQDMEHFQTLLQTAKDTSDNEHFTATSADMLAVASALERVTRDTDGSALSTITAIDTQTINVNNGVNEVYLPSTKALLDANTRDIVGYYLITTTTDEAKVVLQPVLITLKNSNSGENPQTVNVKGYKVKVDKTIEKVQDKDRKVALGGNVVSASGDTAVVAKDDVITYKIVTEVPKYDVNLAPANMKAFTITDTPSAGIKVLETVALQGGENETKPVNLKVVADAGTPSDTSDDKELTYGTHYTVTPNSPANGSFVISIDASIYHTTANPTGSKLEGQKLTITFDATVDDANFDTRNYASSTYADLTAADLTVNTAITKTATDGKAYSDALAAGKAQKDTLAGATILNKAADTITDLEFVQAALAYNAQHETNNSFAWGSLTAELIAAQEESAKELQKSYPDYSVAIAEVKDDVEADLVEKFNASTNPAGTETGLTDAQKVAAKLALDKLKLKASGNDNTAKIGYGNEYATGQGDGNDEDKATVYSVDLDLTKMTENLKLNDKNPVVNPAAGTPNGDWYEDSTTYTPVSGAIFDLIKVNNNTTSAADKSLGYAVSDSNGKLWLLEKGTAIVDNNGTNKPAVNTTIATGNTVYVETVDVAATGTQGDANYVAAHKEYIPYTVADTADVTNTAWRKLTIGDYKLKELSAPAGYKKFDEVAFNIASPLTNNEFTGTYSATNGDTEGKVIKDKTITYVGNEGQLEATILNPKADELPATGGIGTVLFTAGGISIVLIAGALFVMYMKKKNSEDEE